jgi:molecular chaperone GrpE (heat shock protein)
MTEEKKELEINKSKFNAFLEITRELNKSDITPILYGSLGLSRIIGEFKKAQDVDLLVSKDWIGEKWENLIRLMKNNGFKMINEKEHEFKKGEEIIAFGDEYDLKEMANIDINNLKLTALGGAKFKELNPRQYLEVYRYMSRDNYRQEKLGKEDNKKIELIKKYLENNKLNKEQEYLDNWKRAQADLENYKKDQARRMEEFIRFAKSDFIAQILPVLDNFYASTDHISEDQKKSPWVEGIMHIQKQLETVLKDNGVEEIPVKVGDEFDHNVMEAVASEGSESPVKSDKVGSPEAKFNRVNKVLQKGYKMNDKIIRAAKVIVE